MDSVERNEATKCVDKANKYDESCTKISEVLPVKLFVNEDCKNDLISNSSEDNCNSNNGNNKNDNENLTLESNIVKNQPTSTSSTDVEITDECTTENILNDIDSIVNKSPSEIVQSELSQSNHKSEDTNFFYAINSKPFINDADNNSDLQDEEIHLRWEDDDDDNDKNIVDVQNDFDTSKDDIKMELNDLQASDIKLPLEEINKDLCDKTGTGEDSSGETNKTLIFTNNLIFEKSGQSKIEHGLKKPDMMLEIPTQDFMDFTNDRDDEDDGPDLVSTSEVSLDDVNLDMGEDISGDVQKITDTEVTQISKTETIVNTMDTIDKTKEVKINEFGTQIEHEKICTHNKNDGEAIESEFKISDQEKNESVINTLDQTMPNEMVIGDKQQVEIDLVGSKHVTKINTLDDPQPSTSTACMLTEMRRDSDEMGEVSDSLGLLAESTRVLEYDEEQEDDDDGEEDEDFDQDEESSNQMTAEHSEDSNAVQSESDLPKDLQMEIDNDEDLVRKEVSEPIKDTGKSQFEFHISEIRGQDGLGSDDNNRNKIKSLDDSDQNTTEAIIVETSQSNHTSGNDEPSTSEIDDNMCKLKNMLTKYKEEFSIQTPTELPGKIDKDVSETKNVDISKSENVVTVESSSEDDCHDEKEMDNIGSADNVEESKAPPDNKSKLDITADLNEDAESNKNLEATESNKILKAEPKKASILEVFNLDSDEEEALLKAPIDNYQSEIENIKWSKCVNNACKSSSDVQFYIADDAVLAYYGSDCKKQGVVCEPCAEIVAKRNEDLIQGIKNFIPLLELSLEKCNQDLVEISDSESEEETEVNDENKETIGIEGAKVVEEQLTDMINKVWDNFKMDSRLKEAEMILQKELQLLEKRSEKVDLMFKGCQVATDKLRNELYATFRQDRREMPPIVIYDTPDRTLQIYEANQMDKIENQSPPQTRQKRRMSLAMESPAKRVSGQTAPGELDPTINTQLQNELDNNAANNKMDDDNVDVSVVKLSKEVAPADLPPPGDLTRAPLRIGMTVYAMRNTFGLWLKAKIVEIQSKTPSTTFTMCRVKFEHKVTKNSFKLLPARCLAYNDPADVRLTIGTRIIASSEKKTSFYSGVVAEVPNPVNNYRYLVFFDDGHAKYARHINTRLVCECSPHVWEEVHPYSREFVRQYLLSYPERPMVRLHAKQNVKTEWNGKWWNSQVVQVDASLALIMLTSDRMEWIYRGSTRFAPLYLELQAAERHRARAMPRSGPQNRTNMPYVEYTRYDELPQKPTELQTPQQNEEMRRQRAVAKKSTTSSQPTPPPPPPPPQTTTPNLDNVTSRVVYYTPKNAVRPHKMVTHTCGMKCKRTDVLALEDLRTYNPLAKPLLSGWERQVVRFKGHKEVMYRAPCGRRLRNMSELHRYLRFVKSDMPVDLFDFEPNTHCLAEFVLNKCIVGKKDLSHGKENVPVPCVNYYDDSLPEFCSYNTERTPTAGVPLNINPEFLCGCDCEDDCMDKTKCACWNMTLEGARTIGLEGDVGYVYKRLPEPLPSGIYECNSRCKCKNTCLNRVAQHPLQLKLQVFKTLNRGWGIRALNDIPKGAFLCVYAGNLLTDATANLDGLNEGDEYLAELDYIEVVEQMKEGYEEDVPETTKELDKRNSSDETEEQEESSEEEEATKLSRDERDDDFQPGYIEFGAMEFNKRLRKRDKSKKGKEETVEEETEKEKDKEKDKEEGDKDNGDEDCITISDDEDVREPSHFMAQAGMNSNQLASKYRSVRSYFGKDEACYIMDAKVQGNIGRYLNHSCCPNVFVQNVFVDTHDPRFPWVAFFALSHIRAGTELTWNYNYDIGSVPGKVLYCYCGAPNCRGRLL